MRKEERKRKEKRSSEALYIWGKRRDGVVRCSEDKARGRAKVQGVIHWSISSIKEVATTMRFHIMRKMRGRLSRGVQKS